MYSVRTGAGFSNSRFLRALLALGHGPRTIVSPVATAPDNPDYDAAWHDGLARRLAEAGAALAPVDNGSGGAVRYGGVGHWREGSRAAAELVAAARPALVVSFDTPFVDLVPRLAGLDGVRHVHVPRSTGLVHDPGNEERLALERAALGALDPSTRVGAISRYMERHLVADYGVPEESVVWLGSGVLLEDFRPFRGDAVAAALARVGLAPDEPFLLSFGRAEPYKGFDTLLEALALLGAAAPPLVLVAAQVDRRPEFLARLRDLIARHGLDVRLETGFDRELPHLLQQAPSLLAVVVPSRREPFGLVPTEVLANPHTRAVVVAARAGGLEEQLDDGETGFLFAPGDPADAAAALARASALSGEERARHLARVAARRGELDLTAKVERFLAKLSVW